MIGKLFEFLEIDAETRASALVLSDLLTPHFEDIIERFYSKVQAFDISPHVADQVIETLKQKHKRHWSALLHSQFQEEYFASIRRIGIRHRDVALSPKWYVAGYMKLKLAFIEVIIRSDYSIVTKGQRVKTLEKYIAIDMALALSTYDAMIVD